VFHLTCKNPLRSPFFVGGFLNPSGFQGVAVVADTKTTGRGKKKKMKGTSQVENN